jgi:DNA polymerase III alpha subunit
MSQVELSLALDLDGYYLWPDGSISVTPENLSKILIKVPKLAEQGKLFVTKLTEEVESYNRLVDKPIKVKESLTTSFPPNWNLPDKYAQIDLDAYLLSLVDKVKKDHLYDSRLIRLSEEIALFKQLELDEVLKTLIYIVEEFEKHDVVWGVGRGSSCSSYLLYLIGLHEVDSVKYQIEVTDFLRLP